MSNSWPTNPEVESVQRILHRIQGELNVVVECLRDLAACVEWEDDTRPLLDRDRLLPMWDRVERILARYADGVNGIPPGLSPRQQGQNGNGGLPVDQLAVLLDGVQRRLRQVRGLDVASERTEVECTAWTRELGLDVMTAVSQMFDPTAGCLHPDQVAQFRQGRAKRVLLHALELAVLHGVTTDAILRALGAEGQAAACPECKGTGSRRIVPRWLGAPVGHIQCEACSGTGALRC
jgi:hypothetical protein